MKHQIFAFIATATLFCIGCSHPESSQSFLRVEGANIVDGNGEKFFVRGTNLGNWLNPEGYMFGLRRCNSVGRIHNAFAELIGPEATDEFWHEFTTNYVTEQDIAFIAQTGANTIRLPFHYALFTTDHYLGSSSAEDGFHYMDSVITWSRRHGLYVILDMHDCPAGQTGDNIDDSYGYPWLFSSPAAQSLFIDIWQRIATRYQHEPVVLGYELMNEPIAHYFADSLASLNAQLEPLYERTVAAIRAIDTNHIILLGGAQWNGTFRGVFHHDWAAEPNILYACHRYGQSADSTGIGDFITWRDSTGVCMIMTETGHNTYEWIQHMSQTMDNYNIGYTYWPYKKMGSSSWVGFDAPTDWQAIQAYAESDRLAYADIRATRPDPTIARAALMQYARRCQLDSCHIDTAYIQAMGLK